MTAPGESGYPGLAETFGSMTLPVAADAIAPDGSQVRVLLRSPRGSMAHFQLGPGLVSRSVAHRSVEEIWYVLRGRGEMWRRRLSQEETVPLAPGACVSIPSGTAFQFRAATSDALAIIAVTMPAWPGDGEAYEVPGPWEPVV